MLQSFHRRAAAIVVAGGLVFACAACSSGGTSQEGASNNPSGTAAAGASLDPCSLLTSDQVAQAIGTKVGDGKGESENLSASRTCTWETGTTDYVCSKDITSVTLEVVEPPPALKPQFPTAEAYYPSLLSTMQQTGGSVRELQGIGDAAFVRETAAKKGLYIYARKGGTLLRVFGICGNPATLQPELETLIKQALAKA